MSRLFQVLRSKAEVLSTPATAMSRSIRSHSQPEFGIDPGSTSRYRLIIICEHIINHLIIRDCPVQRIFVLLGNALHSATKMDGPLSIDLRSHLVAAVSGGMSVRRAEQRFGVAAASAVRWVEAVTTSGSVEVQP
jgi:hypothetical protein